MGDNAKELIIDYSPEVVAIYNAESRICLYEQYGYTKYKCCSEDNCRFRKWKNVTSDYVLCSRNSKGYFLVTKEILDKFDNMYRLLDIKPTNFENTYIGFKIPFLSNVLHGLINDFTTFWSKESHVIIHTKECSLGSRVPERFFSFLPAIYEQYRLFHVASTQKRLKCSFCNGPLDFFYSTTYNGDIYLSCCYYCIFYRFCNPENKGKTIFDLYNEYRKKESNNSSNACGDKATSPVAVNVLSEVSTSCSTDRPGDSRVGLDNGVFSITLPTNILVTNISALLTVYISIDKFLCDKLIEIYIQSLGKLTMIDIVSSLTSNIEIASTKVELANFRQTVLQFITKMINDRVISGVYDPELANLCNIAPVEIGKYVIEFSKTDSRAKEWLFANPSIMFEFITKETM